jgi:CRISPR-associated endonuclease Cas1
VPKQASTTRRRRGHALIVSGYGVRIHVSRGRLVVSDGIGDDRREQAYPRVGQNISRVVMLAQDGSISLAAVRWLAGVGIPYLHLDRDGRLLAESAQVRLDDPRLRRAQALAGTSPAGVAVARELITRKIRGQRSVVDYLGGDPTAIDPSLELALAASSLDEVRRAESVAALAYWAGWSGLSVQFHRRDQDSVPAHWRRFVRRGSDITGNPRSATDPTNAILNYLYAILEAETTIACRAIGLDPGLGIVHLDAPARASLALDVMEAARPDVDRYVVDLLRNRVFAARDFMETSQGVCRLMPPLRDVLASTAPTWAACVAPHVEAVAQLLAKHAGLPSPPTLLTGQRRRNVRQPFTDRPRAPDAPRPAPAPRRCVDCGTELASKQQRCAECHRLANDQRLIAAGRAEASRRRTTKSHPSARGDVRGRIAESQRKRWAEQREAGAPSGFGTSPSAFHRLVLPRIQGVSSSRLAEATGLSPGYCALVRGGKRIPHARHWAALQLAGFHAREGTAR